MEGGKIFQMKAGGRDSAKKLEFEISIDLLRGVSEEGKKSHFLSTRRLFEGV